VIDRIVNRLSRCFARIRRSHTTFARYVLTPTLYRRVVDVSSLMASRFAPRCNRFKRFERRRLEIRKSPSHQIRSFRLQEKGAKSTLAICSRRNCCKESKVARSTFLLFPLLTTTPSDSITSNCFKLTDNRIVVALQDVYDRPPQAGGVWGIENISKRSRNVR